MMEIKKEKVFYHVCDKFGNGLWFDSLGFKYDRIKKYPGLLAEKIEMEYDVECIDYLSCFDSIEDMLLLFPDDDLQRLESAGFVIEQYISNDYKEFNGWWLINQYNKDVVNVYMWSGLSKIYKNNPDFFEQFKN